MSGMMALLSLDGAPVPEDGARALLAAIAHRGDRAPRLWLDAGIALGHVNLPTTPEAEREHLPAADALGRFWLTWDGRLDNRDELARALSLDPARARAMTDAEYVLAAYARWGDDCVRHLLGDWAVVIWDRHARRLFCAKDPLGWRPLFYAQSGGRFVVGSEPGQLFADGVVPRAVNGEYLLRYLADAMQEPGSTCYAGVSELQGGQRLTVTEGRVAVDTWWRHPRARPRPYRRVEEYVDEFVALFRAATRARLRTNRRLGVFLSGGLDSSYVTAVAVGLGAPLTALTGFAAGTRLMDERAYARLVSEHLGIEHVEVDIRACWSLSSVVLRDDMFDAVEHPPQGAAQVHLARTARELGVGVVLGGEGGDEFLTGDMWAADALLRGRPRTAWRIAQAMRGNRSPVRAFTHQTLPYLVPYTLQDAWRRLRGRPLWLGFPSTVEPGHGWVSAARFARTTAWRPEHALRVWWRQYRNLVSSFVYWRDRHAFAAHGIEHRAPFNDLRIVELMAAAPPWMLRFRGRQKDLLRQALYRVLPATIADRGDNGLFDELVYEGVAREGARVRAALTALRGVPGVRWQEAEREVSHWVHTRHPWWRPSWAVLTAGLWLHSLGVSEPAGTDPACKRSIVAGKGVRSR
jgi:asparagine synthase (glutamine-hydrolysing)